MLLVRLWAQDPMMDSRTLAAQVLLCCACECILTVDFQATEPDIAAERNNVDFSTDNGHALCGSCRMMRKRPMCHER